MFTAEFPAVWHFAALLSLTCDDNVRRDRMRDKWVPQSKMTEFVSQSADVLRALEEDYTLSVDLRERIAQIDATDYIHMILAWRYNSFGHHTDSNSLCMYDTTSTMAHSCSPSAVWHFGSEDAFCLRARVHLNAGDEITISYLGDEDLLRSVPERRRRTEGWLFSCRCDRCCSAIDFSRGFRCPTCFIGSIYMHPKDLPVGPCSCCNSTLPIETLDRYLHLESSYATRLTQTDQSDLEDVLSVLSDARNLFHEQHWIINTLEAWICEGYKKTTKSAMISQKRLLHLQNRLNFLTQTLPIANYTSAWILEELGDCYAEQHLWTEAANKYAASYWYMQILCGPQHPFSESISAKWGAVEDKKSGEGGIDTPLIDTASTTATPSRTSPPTVI